MAEIIKTFHSPFTLDTIPEPGLCEECDGPLEKDNIPPYTFYSGIYRIQADEPMPGYRCRGRCGGGPLMPPEVTLDCLNQSIGLLNEIGHTRRAKELGETAKQIVEILDRK